MSTRIRTIKPELLQDAVTAGLSDMAFRIFVSVISLADDYGRLRAETGWLIGQIYWKRTVVVEDFIAALAELDKLVQVYEVNGQRYAWIRNWAKHQKVSHPGKPRIPAPPETIEKPSGESRETLVPDHGPRTLDLGPRTLDRSEGVEGRRFEPGTAGAMEARSTYELAISSATGKTFGLTRAPYHARDLCDLLNKHAPPVEEQDPFKWLASSAVDWVKVTDPKFSGGWSPSKLLDWLNAGRPDKRERPKSAAEITKQPGDLTAPWLQDDYVGKTGS